MTFSDDPIRDAITDQAADWYVSQRGGAADPETRFAFVQWLKASPAHVEEYLGIAAIARDVATAAGESELQLDELLERARRGDSVVALTPAARRTPAAVRAPGRRTWSHALVAAAIVISVAATTIWSTRDGERFGLPRSYQTAHGERLTQRLPDGSVIQLDTDSQVTVRYSRNERLVALDRGQAVFEVAHSAPRRFRVAAGQASAIAVGTRFDVYRRPGTVTVTVLDGTVAVYASVPQGPSSSAPAGPEVRVGAGYQVEVSGRVAAPRLIDVRAATAWLRGQIVFEDRALGEVVAEFNRYGSVPLEIDSQPLRRLPISGVFDAYDTDSFAAFLQTLDGVVVLKTPTRIRVRSLAADNLEPLSVAR